jgi:glycosyltransferase involved in cell wall biosynthesis
MKVALLSRSAHPLHEPGGMERAVYLQAKHLRARGVETFLVTRPPTRTEGAFPAEVVTVPYGGTRPGAHGRVLDRVVHYPGFSARAGEAAARLVRERGVDVVDAQGLTALGYGRLRRKDPALAAPLVMNPQGMEEHKAGGLKRLALARLRALSREAARLADRVVATDEATRDEVPRLLGVDPAKVVVLPNGVDPDEIAALTPKDPARVVADALPALAAASPLLLSVGRIEAYKGFDDVLAALAVLHDRKALPGGWAWVVAGAGGGEDALRRRVPRHVEGHVHLAGRVPDALLHALYARADAFVHATRYEGSSLVTLEAMAHGLPVVATRAGGIPDKVEDGDTGRLVAPGDVAGLAAALESLLADPARAKAMGARGRARLAARFSSAVLIDRTLALYEELRRARR